MGLNTICVNHLNLTFPSSGISELETLWQTKDVVPTSSRRTHRVTSGHAENRQKARLTTENKPQKHGKGSLEKSERKNANYFIKIYTNPIESRDVIKKTENPALNCLGANWKRKWAHCNAEIKTLRDSSYYSVNMSQYKWKWCTDGPAQKQQKCRDIYKGGGESSLTSVNIPEKSSARSTNQGFDVANTPTRDSTGSAGRSRDGRLCIWKTVGSQHWAFPRTHNMQKHTRWHVPF